MCYTKGFQWRSMIHNYDIEQIIYGVIHASSPRKQLIGRSLAVHLSFVPGPGGKDGAVDGAITDADQSLLAHFQSKLSSKSIRLDEGKILHSDLIRLKPKVCVYIAGVGYDDSVIRLLDAQDVSQFTLVHLLTLKDVFQQSSAYTAALQDIPRHQGGEINWDRFFV